jgi:hypothetical protein
MEGKPKHSPSIRQRKRKVFKSDNLNKIFKNMLKKNIDYDYDTEKRLNEDGKKYITLDRSIEEILICEIKKPMAVSKSIMAHTTFRNIDVNLTFLI